MELTEHNDRYGWLSPDGKFIEGVWGSHTTMACRIIEDNAWSGEFAAHSCMNERDFLCDKGYCLIHDPSCHDARATHIRPLTDMQREFLYGYFIDRGLQEKAEKYLTEEF